MFLKITRPSGCMFLKNDKDLDSEENYEAIFWFSCKAEIYDENGVELQDVQDFARQYISAMNECSGIEALEGRIGWEVRGEHQISIDDLRDFKKFCYDHRSYASKPGGDLPI